uniref:Uncharacterized protein n=1 Tax=Siphoviridae sp. ctZ0X1 TaxID=2825554 RepID=A0A8S5QE13_9CAUD|nr:MAG TPA: hypothetical protein [Siphoviridae sp. ctZ0X1]
MRSGVSGGGGGKHLLTQVSDRLSAERRLV